MLLLSKYHFLLCSISGSDSKLDWYQERFLQHWTKQSCTQKLLLANKKVLIVFWREEIGIKLEVENLQNSSKKLVKTAANMHGMGHTGFVYLRICSGLA